MPDVLPPPPPLSLPAAGPSAGSPTERRWGNHAGLIVLLALAAALGLTRGWASLFFVHSPSMRPTRAPSARVRVS